jgi:hypothetical protein
VLLVAITFSPRIANYGFDRSTSPKWQMVPVGGERVLLLTGAAGLVPRVRDPAILEAIQTVTGRTTSLKLKGRTAGRTAIEWVPSATFAGPVQGGFTLEVSVKAQKKVRTAFHYVSDGRRQVTNRRIRDLDAMIAAANHLLTPQANVAIERKSAAALPIAQKLGRVVRFSSHLTGPPDNVPIAQHEWDDVVAGADATADFNVFFVRRYEQDNTPLVNNTRAGTIATEKNCLLEDNITSASETLAHETIHLLGIDPHSATRSHLIAGGDVRTGRHITRDQANIVNASGT